MKNKGVSTKPDLKKLYRDVEKVLGVKIDRKQTLPENIIRLSKKMDTGRTTVGSRNPYAAVEHELGIKINWKKSEPSAVEKLLTKKGKESLSNVVRKKLLGGRKRS